jgi:uncharacterized tellurite resistance protein B-like protein
MQPRVAHCHLLAEVLSADGMMTDSEREVLERAMADLGLTDEERDQVKHFEGAEGAAQVFAGRPAEERQALLDALVEAALADGKLTANETATVKRIAAVLGLKG